MIVLGIDPGASTGLGLVSVTPLGLPKLLWAKQLPLKEALLELGHVADAVVVERGFVGRQPQNAMTFGERTGWLTCSAYQANPGARLYRAPPNEWRKAVGCPTRDGQAAKAWCLEQAEKLGAGAWVRGPKNGALLDAAEALWMAYAGALWLQKDKPGHEWTPGDGSARSAKPTSRGKTSG